MRQMNKADCPAVESLLPLPAELTYAATVDVRNQECEITELMIRRACVQMDEQQQFPFCAGGNMRQRRAG